MPALKVRKASKAASAAFVVLFSVTGCFSEPRNGSSAAGAEPQSSSGGARLVKSSWNLNGTSWASGRSEPVDDPGLGQKAFTVTVPANWKFKGMILRPGGCYHPQLPAEGLSYTELAPDGYTAIGQLPGASWFWKSDGSRIQPKCATIAMTSATEFLLDIAVPNIRPFATKVAIVQSTPQMQENLRKAQAQANQNNMGPTHHLLDTGRVRVDYMLGDQPMEEMFFTMVDCAETNMPAYPLLHRAATTQRLCQSHGIMFKRAPKGQLDALIAMQPPPPQIDQAWDEHVAQNIRAAFEKMQRDSDRQFQQNQEHFRQQTDAMLARGQAFQDQQRNSFEHAMANDRKAQDAIDHAAHLQVLDSLNRQDFVDPTTGRKYEMSNQYTHSWISSDKESVVLNSDTTFDPNGVVDPVRESWTELVPSWN